MSQVKLGDKNIPFIYQGNQLLYPNTIKDGLVLYFDFKGMNNNQVTKSIAKDLSGKGNNGTLRNFAYTNQSGYDDGLRFDNVDDEIGLDLELKQSFTISHTIDIDLSKEVQFFNAFSISGFYLRRNYNALHCSVYTDKNISSTSGGNQFFYNLTQNNKTKAVVTMVVNGTNKTVTLYGNGDKLATTDTVTSVSDVKLTKLGRWLSGSQNLSGKLLSTQVYNKALTDQEIQQNYKLEKERWGL
ncbi:LamG-like jellyroll fold domain-containing protein [Mammaliicoccus sciuri]|uniref:LamG-like jellyroll fold domain-containing protein n=1 Tax=Mammaliicoccus sciuri TaxID=1296 RepID=UPI00194DFE72|nr:LamG-like jellyroll fold domain-containing protein [Mammaliicoccus sciuri]